MMKVEDQNYTTAGQRGFEFAGCCMVQRGHLGVLRSTPKRDSLSEIPYEGSGYMSEFIIHARLHISSFLDHRWLTS